jgi:ribosomal protein S18 acetylase RimI-like enzyme
MSQVQLREMSDPEFKIWLSESKLRYAKDKETEGLSSADALALSEKSFRDLLPHGKRSPKQWVRAVEENGKLVGSIWWGSQQQGSRSIAWIYNIEIQSELRGKGLGRAAMQAAETAVREQGFPRLGLHVFGYNHRARKLYQSLDFQETNVVMYKTLD